MEKIYLFFLFFFPGISFGQNNISTSLETVDYAEVYQYLKKHPYLVFNEKFIPLENFVGKFYRMEGVWLDQENNHQVVMKGEILTTQNKSETLRLIHSENKSGTYVYFEEEKGEILVKTMWVNQASSSFLRKVKIQEEKIRPVQQDSVLHSRSYRYQYMQKDSIVFPGYTEK